MKEWKGNKRSVRVMNGDAHNPDRAAGDYYTTDMDAVREFLDMPIAFSTGKIWEPACGCGNISKVLEERGLSVISTDLYDRGYGQSGIDFLKTTAVPDGVSVIMTNPPYSLSDEFILHAMDILPERGCYIALLNINYLSGVKRHKQIYSQGYLSHIFVYSHRIHCRKNNEDAGHSSPVNYAWFVFQKCEIKTFPTISFINRI